MNETTALPAQRVPTVYFIDDSATMREVIKIAFRRERINVVTCHDAASALAQFADTAPDAVITDVIMPDKDGYEVCQFIKQNPFLSKTPVILMSGVVNRSVAERAIAVEADELIRKPFQPQELIARVKGLLHPKPAQPSSGEAIPPPNASEALSSFFAPSTPAPAPKSSAGVPEPRSAVPGAASPSPVPPLAASPVARRAPTAPSIEMQRLRIEIQRLEMLVKKLQAELAAERQYCAALESHIKTLQEAE